MQGLGMNGLTYMYTWFQHYMDLHPSIDESSPIQTPDITWIHTSLDRDYIDLPPRWRGLCNSRGRIQCRQEVCVVVGVEESGVTGLCGSGGGRRIQCEGGYYHNNYY